MKASAEGDWLGLRERRKQRVFRPSEWGRCVRGLDVHGEDEVLGAGELKVLEEVEGMSGVDGEFLVCGEKTESSSGSDGSGGSSRDIVNVSGGSNIVSSISRRGQ
eukprot:g28719.t1